ncbi:tetratricopeptide repeat-containing sensor histidine kinase [Winogradskyella thalassocola]|uniref:Tetratricopeptide repeat-containing protein n=1 Tax=Winogradskyella thalassocola TaxID=262004 RepID=A0A1G8CVW3_9FLAO|nr:tetratricopeptide repeat protein [Winogradskyella thalassocola]SDH49464.1 Tetratricopeptide repeat-containing protein [Winogradskyella thalassocola]
MKIIVSFFIILFLSISTTISSQTKVIDSLNNELTIHKEKDTTRVNILYGLAIYNFQNDLETTKLHLKEAEDLSNEINYIKGKAKVLYLKGILESRKSNYKTSLDFFKGSLKHYESIDDQAGIAAVYNAFGITHFIQSEYDEAIFSYQKAFEIQKNQGKTSDVINSLLNIGNVFNETGRYDEAISNYKKALNHSVEINDETNIATINYNLSVLYKVQGNYPLAIETTNNSLEFKKTTGDTLGIAHILSNLGEIYTSIEKYDTALEYHKQSLNFALQKESKSLVATNYNNIGNYHLHKKEYPKALEYYNKSLEISQKINNIKQVVACFLNLGEINLLLNRPVIARENYVKANEISLKADKKDFVAYSFLGISETYIHEKKYKEALPFTQKGKKLSEELELLEPQKKASELLSEIYKYTNNYKKAFESLKQFKTLNDSLFNKENIEKITQLEFDYKYKQALDSASIRELKLTKIVDTTSLDLKKSQRNLLLGVIVFLVIVLILGTIIFFLRLRNEKSKSQNIEIEQKLLRSQMTPHFIFNSLSVLQGMILNKENKKAVFYLSKFSKLLRIILENSRDKIVLLDEELEAVNNYLELQNLEESQAFQYTILIDETIDSTLFKVPPMLIQPFIENAVEHAFKNQEDNRKIDIQLKYVNKKLICTITDNGIGIDAEKEPKKQHKKSLATTITSERLKVLSKDFNMKGSISIEDRKKYNAQGTIVTLVIPYKIDTV